tara:strand:- start:2225 stop:2815 length:591 start_codon:yes stop_codon:yes gene_type:complete
VTYRIEKKLYIKKENFFDFKKKLFEIGAKQIFKTRKVNSLYFDNLKQDMYQDSIEGLTPRKKIRVRNYPDDDSGFFLETKISSVEGRFKTNKKISYSNFINLKKIGVFDDKYGICKPIMNVKYDREYFKKEDVRITLDYNILYKLYNSKIMKRDEEIVAELKTSMSKNLDDLFEMYPYQEIRFSKYCNGIKLFFKE